MASSRSKRNTGPKLNARGHDPDRPVPWEYTDPETNERVHLSYKYERQEEERMKREHRAQHALLWTKSQPSTASDEDAELAGIGNWVILNTEHAANLRLLGHEVITNGRHLVNAELHFNQLRQLEFVQLSRDLDGAHERDIGISQGNYLDLPITSVRAIRLRIANMQRKLQQSKQALETKPGQDLVRRALKILGCGVVVNKATTDKRTNKTITKVTIANCNTKSCGMPECSLRSYYHKRAKYRANLTTALQDAKNNSTQYRLVHVTLATDWALPTDEPRRARNNPILSTTGHKANHCKAWLPDHKSKQPNLYLTRLHEHLEAMRKVFGSQPVRRAVLNTPHRVTETAFLVSGKQQSRSFPNPHTHAVIAVPSAISDRELVATLLTALKKRVPNGNVKIKDVHSSSEEDVKEQASALGAYDAKEQAVTPHESKHTEYTPQEQRYLAVLGLDWQPHSTELMACLDDKSLSEVIESEDYDASVMYHSDVKALPTVSRKQEVIVISMKPETKPLGKDKGKPTHTRRLLMFFNPRSNRVTRSKVEVLAIESDSLQVASRRSAQSSHRSVDDLELRELGVRELGGLVGLEAVEAGLSKLDEVVGGNYNEVGLMGFELWGVATQENQDNRRKASAMSFAAENRHAASFCCAAMY